MALEEILHLPQPSSNALVVMRSPSKAFGGDILVGNLFTTLAPVETEAAASLGLGRFLLRAKVLTIPFWVPIYG